MTKGAAAKGGKRKPRLRNRLIALAVATLMSLLLGELGTRLLFDVQVTCFLRDWDPELGVRYKKNITTTINYPEFSMEFSTNSRGFRGPEPPPSLDGSIIFLGDSFTEGWGVDDDEAFPSLIRDELAKRYEVDVPVVNAAMAATGQGRWLKLLQNDLRDARPRLVVFQVCWNDCVDNLLERQYRVARFRSVPDQVGTLSEVVDITDKTKPFIRQIQPVLEAVPGLEDSHLFGLIRQMIRPVGFASKHWDLSSNEPDTGYRKKMAEILTRSDEPWLFTLDKLFLALVEQSMATCHGRGWPTALISVRIGGLRFEHLQRVCARFDAPLLDVRNREEEPQLYYAIDSHWNEAGHRFVADLVLRQLLSEESEYLVGVK